MRKLPTGELCAGEPHAQFGGRGGRGSFPTPIFDPEPSFSRINVPTLHMAAIRIFERDVTSLRCHSFGVWSISDPAPAIMEANRKVRNIVKQRLLKRG